MKLCVSLCLVSPFPTYVPRRGRFEAAKSGISPITPRAPEVLSATLTRMVVPATASQLKF